MEIVDLPFRVGATPAGRESSRGSASVREGIRTLRREFIPLLVDARTFNGVVHALVHRYTASEDVLVAEVLTSLTGDAEASARLHRLCADGELDVASWLMVARRASERQPPAISLRACTAEGCRVFCAWHCEASVSDGAALECGAWFFRIFAPPNLPDSLAISVRMHGAIYEARAPELVLSHLENLLHGFLGHAGPVAKLPLLSASERDELLHGANLRTLPVFRGGLHQLVQAASEASVEGTLAVESSLGGKLSFDALRQRIDVVSEAIWDAATDSERLGAAREMNGPLRPGRNCELVTFVGVFVERCSDMLTALFAVMAAGLAYVPLDPLCVVVRCMGHRRGRHTRGENLLTCWTDLHSTGTRWDGSR